MNVAAQIGYDVSLTGHPFVARLSRFMKLSVTDLRSLEHIIESERLVKKRKDLVVDGDAYRNLCFVKDGYAIRYKLLRSGKRQILNVILPGDVIGFPVSFFELISTRPSRPLTGMRTIAPSLLIRSASAGKQIR